MKALNVLGSIFSACGKRQYYAGFMLLFSILGFACASATERRKASLAQSVDAGDLVAVKAIIAETERDEVNPDQVIWTKDHGLGFAVRKGNKEIVNYLIASGAKYLDGPYEHAVFAGDFEMAEILLKAGAKRGLLLDVMANDKLNEMDRIKLMKFLIEVAKDDVNGYRNIDKQTAVWMSVKRLSEDIHWKIRPSKIDEPTSMLIKAGADLNIRDTNGHSALCFIIDQPQIASELIKAGAINNCDEEKRRKAEWAKEQEKWEKERRQKEEREKEQAEYDRRWRRDNCTTSEYSGKFYETCKGQGTKLK